MTADDAPSRTHALLQPTPCLKPGCYQLLVNDTIHDGIPGPHGGHPLHNSEPRTSAAGLILNLQDLDNFYAVLIYPASNMVKAYRFSTMGNPS